MFSVSKKFFNRSLLSVATNGAALGLLLVNPAFAADKSLVNIKQVQVSDNDRIDILLDGKLDASQVRTEFLNDIIQLSVSDASVYPAKISSVSGKNLSKIFIYQYAPKLVRVRLTVKGKADAFQDKVHVKPAGKMLTIRLNGAGVADKVATSAAQVRREGSTNTSVGADADERALLEKVLRAPVAKPADKPVEKVVEKVLSTLDTNADKPKADEAATEIDGPGPKSGKRRFEPRNEALGGRKDNFSAVKVLASLAGVVLLLGAVLLGLKRVTNSRSQNSSLGRWVRKSLGRQEKMIEVLAAHHLGTKKSIHMVKVAGRTLVLGVADDSINLITELNGAPAEMGTGAVAAGASVDEDFLSTLGEQLAQESGRPSAPVLEPRWLAQVFTRATELGRESVSVIDWRG